MALSTFSCGFLALVAFSSHSALGHNLRRQVSTQDPSSNPFAAITPSESLSWTPCYGSNETLAGNAVNVTGVEFECARLLVPLDYSDSNATASEKVALAIIRAPATDRDNYKGPLFFNFGGPANPGTTDLVALRPQLEGWRQMFGPGYDLVAWDQRGMGSTTPTVSCFPNQESRDFTRNVEALEMPFAANDSLAKIDALHQAIVEGCERYSADLLPHLSTFATVQDLRRMVDAFGHSSKLSFVGISYGTLVGSMFAMNYPDHIERMALDSVRDLTAHLTQHFEPAVYQDFEAGVEDFFHLCHLAGPSRCRFWFPSPQEIKSAFWELDDRLHYGPLPVQAGILDWVFWRTKIGLALYSSVAKFGGPDGIDLMFAVAYNSSRGLPVEEAMDLNPPSQDTKSHTLVDPRNNMTNEFGNRVLIWCLDKPDWQLNNWEEVVPYLQSEAVTRFGPFVPALTPFSDFFCGRFKTLPAQRSDLSCSVKTSAPVLIVNMLRDPTTPLEAAFNTSRLLEGSSVAVHNTTAHSVISHLTPCMAQVWADYFHNLTMPVNGTICQPEILPFALFPNGTAISEEQIQALVKASTART